MAFDTLAWATSSRTSRVFPIPASPRMTSSWLPLAWALAHRPRCLSQLGLPAGHPAAADPLQDRHIGFQSAGLPQGRRAQAFKHLLGAGRPFARLLAQQRHDQSIQRGRDGRVLGAWRHDGGIQVLRDHRQGVVAGERQRTRDPFIQQYAQSVEVRTPVDPFALRLLRRQVEDRPDDQALAGDTRGERERQPKIGQLGGAVGGENDILGLEVAVDDAQPVSVGQRLAQLAGNDDGCLECGGRLLESRLPFRKLHHDVGQAVDFPGVVDGDDVGVMEARRHARLAQQALAILGRQVRFADELEGDVPVEQLVVGVVDDRHPAAPELGPEAEAGVEEGAGLGTQWWRGVGGRTAHPLIPWKARRLAAAGAASAQDELAMG